MAVTASETRRLIQQLTAAFVAVLCIAGQVIHDAVVVDVSAGVVEPDVVTQLRYSKQPRRLRVSVLRDLDSV